MKKIKFLKKNDAVILLKNENLIFLKFFQKSFHKSKYFTQTSCVKYLNFKNKILNKIKDFKIVYVMDFYD